MSQTIELSSAPGLLNSCRAVRRDVDALEQRVKELQRRQRDYIQNNGTTKAELDNLHTNILIDYRVLVDRVQRIKQQPESTSSTVSPHVTSLHRKIRGSLQDFQKSEAEFEKQLQEQQRRQYLIVNPDASQREIDAALEHGNEVQIFQQALLSSGRSGQAQSTLSSVRQRHDALQQIQQTMQQLNELFETLGSMVEQQESAVVSAELTSDQVKEDLERGNDHMDNAVDLAKAARRKKWILLGIWVTIVVVIIIIVLIVLRVLHVI